MHRFFVDSTCINGNIITISGDDVNHISRVLRLQPNEQICICDQCGNDYLCSITNIQKDTVSTKILSVVSNKTESNIDITLYQGIPKGDKMDLIIQKCVELGVKCFVPVITSRTVVKLKNDGKKEQRWQKISNEAAKQSVRGILPKVRQSIPFAEAIKNISAESNSLNILAYENEKNLSLKSVLKQTNKTKINIIIGPEGGFEKQETALAAENNVNIVTLGPRILRTETAPIAATTAIMYELGDW